MLCGVSVYIMYRPNVFPYGKRTHILTDRATLGYVMSELAGFALAVVSCSRKFGETSSLNLPKNSGWYNAAFV